MISELINSDIMDKYTNSRDFCLDSIDSYPDYLSLAQMRQLLGGIGKRQAFTLILSGEIKSFLVGRTRIIKKSDFLTYIKSLELSDEQKQYVEDILRMHYEKLFADYPDVVTSETLENMLNGSSNYISRRLTDKRIKSLYIGRAYRIPKQHIIEYAISREHQREKRRFPHLV